MRIENSFIPVEGVGERTERRLWRAGIVDWDAFTPSALGPTTGRRVEDFIDAARDRLDRGDSAFFGRAFPDREHWRLYEDFRDDACFLDIETTGLSRARHDVTVVSLHRAGETTTLVRGDDLTGTRLRSALGDAPLLVTFNGKRFDVPFLTDAFDVAVDVPHLDLMYPCRRLGLSGGLKRIERELAVDRDEPDISGRDAVRLWHAYRRGDRGALDRLVSYNRDDTVNLAAVADAVCARLHREVFAAELETAQPRLSDLGSGSNRRG